MSDTLRAADAEARRLACTQFDSPIVLEAGAGTGKTTALVGRIVAWCLRQGWERARAALMESAADVSDTSIAERAMSRVVAITFTERAAVEMGTKVANTLRDLSRGKVPESIDVEMIPAAAERTSRATALVAALHLLRTSTIHGFCSRLLSSYPIEAGVHPAFTIDSDGAQREAAVREIFTDALAALYGSTAGDAPPAQHSLALAEDGYGPDELYNALDRLTLLGADSSEVDVERVGDTAADQARQRLIATLDRTLAIIEPPIKVACASSKRVVAPPRTLAALQELRATLAAASGAAPLIEALGAVDPKIIEDLGKWARYDFGSEAMKDAVSPVSREFAESCATLRRHIQALLKVDTARFTAVAVVLQSRLADVYARLKRRGMLTFDQLIRAAARLVGDNATVAAKVAAGIDLLLVDEFQDTDKEQCRLIAAIALDDALHTRPSLFLVGDPKQSIYGWRSADLDAYESFVMRALNGAAPQRLSVNYRSVTAILDEVRRLTQPLLRYRPGVQPEFQELLTAPKNLGLDGVVSAGRRPVEFWLSDTTAGRGSVRKAERRELEARAIAADIAQLRSEGAVPLAKIAILLRATTQQEHYLRELKAYGLPFVVEGDRSFYRRRETIDAAALLTTVLDPHDQVQLTALLRGPLCGVPDAALLPLWQRRFPELASQLGWREEACEEIATALREVAVQLPSTIPGIERIAGWEQAAAHTLAIIAELRRAYAEEPADRFIESLRSRLLHEETESARWLGAHRLANIEQLLRRFQTALSSEGGGTQAALQALRRALAEQRDEREASVADDTLDAVRVLSIHKAKGLTFEVVYVAALDHGLPNRNDDPHLERRRSASKSALMLCGAAEFAWAEVDEAATVISEAEAARVLYVAITRPAKRLVLCGAWSEDPGSESLSTLAATRLGSAPLEALLSSANAEFIDPHGVRWLDLVRREPLPAPATPSVATTDRSDTAAIAAAQHLDQARGRAAERRALVLTAPISGDVHALLETHETSSRETDADEPEPSERSFVSRETRQTAGTLVHRVLELLPIDAHDRDAAWRAATGAALRNAEISAAKEARALLDQFRHGPLWERWWLLAPQIVGREVPVLLRPDDPARTLASDTPKVPLWAYAGAIDLLYIDPSDGSLVIADYKTDAEPNPQRYASPLAAYADAIKRALRVESKLRTELWFIAVGTITEVQR